MYRGWVRIYRKLIHSKEWLDMSGLPKGFPRPCAWIDLICLANHTENYVRPRGDGLRVKVLRGQCGWSIKSFAERWGWSPSRVSCFLLELSDDAQISTQKSNKTTIITIINYDLYQGEEAQNAPQNDSRTGADQSQTDTNNNNKELKELEKDTTAPSLGKIEEDDILVSMPELALLRTVPKYPFDVKTDFAKLSELSLEFPSVDVVPMLKNWVLFITDNPFKANSSPRAKLRNQFKMAHDKGMYKKASDNGEGPRRKDAGDLIRKAEKEMEQQEGAKE